MNLGSMNYQVIAIEGWSGSGSGSQSVVKGAAVVAPTTTTAVGVSRTIQEMTSLTIKNRFLLQLPWVQEEDALLWRQSMDNVADIQENSMAVLLVSVHLSAITTPRGTRNAWLPKFWTLKYNTTSLELRGRICMCTKYKNTNDNQQDKYSEICVKLVN